MSLTEDKRVSPPLSHVLFSVKLVSSVKEVLGQTLRFLQ